MISFNLSNGVFQVRAAAIFTWQDCVLLHRLTTDDFWALPGGRVEFRENAAGTVVREMHEELGEQVVCDSLSYVAENFFGKPGAETHEIGLYFKARFAENSKLLDITRSHAGIEGNKALEFKWFNINRLTDVDLRPTFLREYLANSSSSFKHVVQHG